MSDSLDPENPRVTDDIYTAGRDAFDAGAFVLENPWPGTGHIGRAWFAGRLDAFGDRVDGGQRAARAIPYLVADDRAELF